ncbi:MAG: alpha/beta hydrolase [Pseudomonadota bacterium]
MPEGLKAGLNTYWRTFGAGPDPALLIHCGLGHSGSWAAIARYLDTRLAMTAFDMPGHGRTAACESHVDVQELTALMGFDLLAAPAHVIGHSFGATVALRMAVMRSRMIRSLVLIEPVFFAAALHAGTEEKQQVETDMSGFVDAMERGDQQEAARLFLGIWGNAGEWDTLTSQERARMGAKMHLIELQTPTLFEDKGHILDPNVLETLDVPVLLLRGARSPGSIAAIHASLARRLPNVRSVVIEGAAHMAPVTHPAQVADQILAFLSSKQRAPDQS